MSIKYGVLLAHILAKYFSHTNDFFNWIILCDFKNIQSGRTSAIYHSSLQESAKVGRKLGQEFIAKKADKHFTLGFFYVHDSDKPNNLCKSLACHGPESILKLYDLT